MKHIVMLSLMLLTTPAVANPYDYKILRIIDGDTVEIEAPYLPPELGKTLSIRILGVDTPEKGARAHCTTEAAKAKDASRFTAAAIANAKTKQIVIKGWDKYGGRVLGDIILDGKPLSKMLIDAGKALSYNGGKKSDWCSTLK